jgi:hypothetical protein
VRPILNLPANTLLHPQRVPGVLRIRATAEQLKRIKALLDREEAAESPSCKIKSKGMGIS